MPVMGPSTGIMPVYSKDIGYSPIQEYVKELDKILSSPIDKQEGGTHYKDFAIQPMQYIMKNNLGWCEGNVVKLVSRWKLKGGVGDLRKAIHYLEVLIDEVEKNEVSNPGY